MAGVQINLYVGIGVTWVAALVALIMRVTARRITRVNWWFDDYFSVLAFIFATGYCAILIEWALHWSLGKRMPDSLDEAARENILYHLRIFDFFHSHCYASSLASSKISILSFYWRLFKRSIIRIPILVLLASSAIWWILRTVLLNFRCVPTRAIWDKTITNAVCNLDIEKFFLSTVTTHFLLDVAILVLPMVPVFKLRLPLPQKLAVACFFLLGTVVCTASCVVLYQVINWPADSSQLPYDYGLFTVGGAVELNLAVVSGCCPLLRPVIHRIIPDLFPSSAATGQRISRPSNAIRLTTITKTEEPRKADDSSSTHQLADSKNGQLDDYMHDDLSEVPAGVYTIISSETNDWGPSGRREERDLTGIHVRQETVVEVKGA